MVSFVLTISSSWLCLHFGGGPKGLNQKLMDRLNRKKFVLSNIDQRYHVKMNICRLKKLTFLFILSIDKTSMLCCYKC